MSDSNPPDSDPTPGEKGYTLDLSKKPGTSRPEGWDRKRRGASPITTKIIDLSTPEAKPEPPPPKKQSGPKGKKSGAKKSGGKKRGKPASGSTLADLLDPETLAKLRGE